MITVRADSSPIPAGRLGIGELAPLPADLFAWIPQAPWEVTGRTVTRDAVQSGRRVSVTVTTFVETFERPSRTIACFDSLFIDEVEVYPAHDIYEPIIDSADDFINDHQTALVRAHREYGT